MARRRKQKKADETLVDIVEVREQAQSFMERNQNLVFGIITGIVVLIGGLFAYNNYYKAPLQQEAVSQMSQAQIQFERDSFALALTNPGGGYMGFLDIIDNYGSTEAANLAHYYAGISYLHLGQYEAAIDYLRDYDPEGSITPIMKLGAIGDAHSELGNLEQALTYYNRAVRQGENEILTPYYLKKIGMLHEKNGSYAEALESYRRIMKEYPDSPDGRDIEKYIARVSSNS